MIFATQFLCASLLFIVFIFMDLVSDFSTTEEAFGSCHFWGTLLSIPVLLYGLSSLMTVWVFFIGEVWNGFPFLRTIGRGHIDEVVIEWVSLSLMLGLPSGALLVQLFRQADDWWETTMVVWYVGILAYFAIFSILTVYYETKAAYQILHRNAKWNATRRGEAYEAISCWAFLIEAIKSTQNQTWCGFEVKKQVTSYDPDIIDDFGSCYIFLPSCNFLRRWYAKITQWKILCLFFEKVSPPEKLVNLDDVILNRQFLTAKNWTIEKGLSMSHTSKNVVVIRGNEKLKKSQIISSIVCMGLSIVGAILFVLAFFLWFGFDTMAFLLISGLIGMVTYKKIATMWHFYRLYQKQIAKKKKCDTDHYDDEDGIYQRSETYRISRPKLILRIFLFLVHFGLFYIYLKT